MQNEDHTHATTGEWFQAIIADLYASSKAKRDRYRKVGMELETCVFEAHIKRLEDEFGFVPSD